MTNTIVEHPADELPPPVPPVPPAPHDGDPVPAPAPRPSRRSGWHVVAIVVGCLLILPGLGIGAGGLATTLASTVGTDDGYFDVDLRPVESDGVAVAALDLWDQAADDDDWPWALDWLDIDVRLTADRAGGGDVFIGLARSSDVDAYLADVAFSEVVSIDDRRPRYLEHDGPSTIDAPTTQDFWTATAVGPGDQRLDWEARGGSWAIVVMNADGSPGVDADVEVGVHSGRLTPIGVTLLVVGGVMTLTAITLIVVGVRGRRR